VEFFNHLVMKLFH